MRYKFTLAYDGTDFVGWQVQKAGTSIQAILEGALAKLLQQKIRITGAGRTDAGVHALGQVAHCPAVKIWDCNQLVRALNYHLPLTIRIKSCELVPDTFHAVQSALSKCYHYHLWLEEAMNPMLRLYRLRIRESLDIELLRSAAKRLCGTHDFASFANVGGNVKSTTRSLYRLDVVPQEGGYRLEFEGNGFLYRMVRNLTGTLLEIGKGRMQPECIDQLLEARDRRQAPPCAPAHALFLVQVNYAKRFKSVETLI